MAVRTEGIVFFRGKNPRTPYSSILINPFMHTLELANRHTEPVCRVSFSVMHYRLRKVKANG